MHRVLGHDHSEIEQFRFGDCSVIEYDPESPGSRWVEFSPDDLEDPEDWC